MQAEMLRIHDLRECVGLSTSTLYEQMAQGLLVRPVRIGARAVGWPRAEIVALLDARIAGASDDALRLLVETLHERRRASCRRPGASK